MRYAAAIIVDTDDAPDGVLSELVSTLEYEGKATVLQATILTKDGTEVATHKEKTEKWKSSSRSTTRGRRQES